MNRSTKWSYKIKKALTNESYLNRKRNFKESFIKTSKVINSCNTLEELEIAENMCECFTNLFSWKPELQSVLEIELKTRKDEIIKLSKGERFKLREKIINR